MNIVNSFNAKNLDNITKATVRKNFACHDANKTSDEKTDSNNRFLNQHTKKKPNMREQDGNLDLMSHEMKSQNISLCILLVILTTEYS